jgi:acetylornithine deacetylase
VAVSRALHVVKLGSRTLFHRPRIYEEIAALISGGTRVVIVAGGATAIDARFAELGRPPGPLLLPGGDEVRSCTAADMRVIAAVYDEVVLPHVGRELAARGLAAHVTPAARARLVSGVRRRPLKAMVRGRPTVVRDHWAGDVVDVRGCELLRLLDRHDAVCLSPPMAGPGPEPLNLDADVLAASVATAVGADRLRFVTATAGVLSDPDDPASTVRLLTAGDRPPFVQGRMKQKVRAAAAAVAGCPDVAITGPHGFLSPAGCTRVTARGAV